jgi:tRNA modification GTPase
LFNALLGEARALVTPVPGTTRDAIEALLDTPVVPLRLVDTAGLRETSDVVEQLGIEVSERYLRAASVVVACGEGNDDVERTVGAIRTLTNGVVLGARTKSDLRTRVDESVDASHAPANTINVSAVTREGLPELLEAMIAAAREIDENTTGDAVITRERQRAGVMIAQNELDAFRSAWSEQRLPAIVAATHLDAATDALDAVVGSVSVDDILDRVFSDFCVGK